MITQNNDDSLWSGGSEYGESIHERIQRCIALVALLRRLETCLDQVLDRPDTLTTFARLVLLLFFHVHLVTFLFLQLSILLPSNQTQDDILGLDNHRQRIKIAVEVAVRDIRQEHALQIGVPSHGFLQHQLVWTQEPDLSKTPAFVAPTANKMWRNTHDGHVGLGLILFMRFARHGSDWLRSLVTVSDPKAQDVESGSAVCSTKIVPEGGEAAFGEQHFAHRRLAAIAVHGVAVQHVEFDEEELEYGERFFGVEAGVVDESYTGCVDRDVNEEPEFLLCVNHVGHVGGGII